MFDFIQASQEAFAQRESFKQTNDPSLAGVLEHSQMYSPTINYCINIDFLHPQAPSFFSPPTRLLTRESDLKVAWMADCKLILRWACFVSRARGGSCPVTLHFKCKLILDH